VILGVKLRQGRAGFGRPGHHIGIGARLSPQQSGNLALIPAIFHK
jgi:hypothetical protein